MSEYKPEERDYYEVYRMRDTEVLKEEQDHLRQLAFEILERYSAIGKVLFRREQDADTVGR